MQSDHKQQISPRVRVTRRRNNRISLYSDSFPRRVHDSVQPRIISSNPLNTPGKDYSPKAAAAMNSFCPYSGLNYDSSSHRSNSSHFPLYGEMRLKTANERRHQQDRRLSQGIALGLATLLIALTVAGMFWMQYSNAHAATSPYEVQSGS